MTYEEAPPSGLGRNALIAIGVVLLHVVALWALHTGLLRRAVEVIVPAVLLSEFVTPPAPVVAPEPGGGGGGGPGGAGGPAGGPGGGGGGGG
ncbi:MAG: hypothetical protein KJZ76_12675, partial [Burkholderiaceae bacterium]|nr:hypothetical protein [Burkholderiaceae bacterium]